MKEITTTIEVMHFPDRKKPCLVISQGNQGIVLGTFRNEKMAKLFNDFAGIVIGEYKPLL